MLRLIDLTASIIKYCFWFTLIRLVSTAFGFEFGISRQYLRLLEWLLDRGQEKIERCESENRLQRLASNEQRNGVPRVHPDDGDELRSRSLDLPAAISSNKDDNNNKENGTLVVSQNGITADPQQRKRRLGIRFSQEVIDLTTVSRSKDDSNIASKNGSGELLARRRRVSTPDGPPVFLLDDDYEENDEDVAATTTTTKMTRPDEETTGDRPIKKHEFHLEDAARLVARGLAAIIDDEVTKRFTPEELKGWNLLTRTNAKNYQFMSRSLGLCWLLGLLIRYAILMPLRIMFTIVGFGWLVATMSLIGLLPRPWRSRPYSLSSLMSFRMLSCGITSRLRFHNRQWRAQKGDVCVANHTSPIDVVLLACDNCYALVGQRHGGLLGVLEVALSRATNHVWFDRSESRDRKMVTQKLSEHVARRSNLPVLIFPEGTCINNSAVMRFSKGIFGLDTTVRVCPVAIKYDPRYGDPFWCSSKQSYLQYLLMMMSSWAIKCDVWYLPPMERLEGESSAEFANRVKSEIAKQAGLEDLSWDGQLKRMSVKPTWLYQQQEDYVKRLKLE